MLQQRQKRIIYVEVKDHNNEDIPWDEIFVPSHPMRYFKSKLSFHPSRSPDRAYLNNCIKSNREHVLTVRLIIAVI
jgi:hypothetical protein